MRHPLIEIAGERHLETLGNCGGYYSSRMDENGKRLGPLVAYAGTYVAADSKDKHYVGWVYANFAKAEPYPNILRFFAKCLSQRLDTLIGLANIDVFCGAPLGGYSLCDALGLSTEIKMIKAEKKVTRAKTDTSKEESTVVFGRHSPEPGERVVIVEDVCNNFSTTYNLIGRIKEAGAEVTAIACFLNRSLTVNDVYSPGTVMLRSGRRSDLSDWKFPVISLVYLPINEWKQEDPAVAADIAANNVAWDPKKEWGRLMKAMHPEP